MLFPVILLAVILVALRIWIYFSLSGYKSERPNRLDQRTERPIAPTKRRAVIDITAITRHHSTPDCGDCQKNPTRTWLAISGSHFRTVRA